MYIQSQLSVAEAIIILVIWRGGMMLMMVMMMIGELGECYRVHTRGTWE